jgi:ABC-type multidrug transport system permease subunit
VTNSALAQLTLQRFREFVREPEAMFWTFFFPILIAVALGIAFRGGTASPVQVAVQDGTHAAAIESALRETGRADVQRLDEQDAADALRRGDVALVIAVGADGSLAYRYDRTREDARLARLVVDDVLQRSAGRTDPRATDDQLITDKGSRYIDFLIPGLIGLNLLSTGLWGVGYGVVKMRTDRLLKRLATTPIRHSDFLLSFMLNRLVFLAGELAILLSFAWLAFRVPIRGSLVTLGFVAALGAFTFTALGLLIASRTRTLEAVQGWMNLVAVPMWVLSGVFFSAGNFPDAMQPFIQALPLTALNNALRAIMLDGAGVAGVAGSLAIITGWGLACFVVAVQIFRWK